ncbi:DUF1961 family protein [Actomonas aquatica]|uniref:DUF1961 family protein n=1 Tax=Actomonas aquatica TaxID=2866162 RepID=A0ABZ1C3X4_9BACT|nr:DUF1961 family protein [Opitutus sp. WL0086]WRQ86397.1 DUF1961 family protein [Opitutus sp. WL0086]
MRVWRWWLVVVSVVSVLGAEPSAGEQRTQLAEPLPEVGAVSLWLELPQAHRTGVAAASWRQPIVQVGDGLLLEFTAGESTAMLSAAWLHPETGRREREVRVILPEWPGPGWHHLAVSWDRSRGACNVWLDGTPYLLGAGTGTAWTMPPGRDVVLTPDRFAVKGLRWWSGETGPETWAAEAGERHRGGMDALLGVSSPGEAPTEAERGRLWYERSLVAAEDVADWVLEGPGVVAHDETGMRVRSARPDGPQGHVVYWCPEVWPERFWAEWEIDVLGEEGLCIVFFAARGRDGIDMFDTSMPARDGVFLRYTQGAIDAYHISYFARTPGEVRRVSNLRRNRGAFLLANGPAGVVDGGEPGRWHRVVLVKDGDRVRLAVNGRAIIDYTDDGERAGPVLGAGRIGLRQMQWTDARYRNFRVYALAEEDGVAR